MALQDSLDKYFNEVSVYCPFQRLINKLSEQDRETLNQAVKRNYPNLTIARALRAEGHKIAEISIMEHRKGICRCPKTAPKKS